MGKKTNQRTVMLKRRKGESFGFSLECASGKYSSKPEGKNNNVLYSQKMVARFS
jgi:hypothetical protein